ncbi:putative coatomer, gamma subunit, appendage, Ig-like subdomain-containing protein [Helianthus annuus]|nr:putative coatomer, gamma subunit, appendage, Ig-like subdomain-containing protein [Helianthus annuus]
MEFDDHLTCSWSAVELINRLCFPLELVLTEAEKDYAVNAMKHIFDKHVVKYGTGAVTG